MRGQRSIKTNQRTKDPRGVLGGRAYENVQIAGRSRSTMCRLRGEPTLDDGTIAAMMAGAVLLTRSC